MGIIVAALNLISHEKPPISINYGFTVIPIAVKVLGRVILSLVLMLTA
jgi:hypothetical protein